MKTISTKKGQLEYEELKAFIISIRCDYVALLQLVKVNKKAPLTEEEIEYCRRVFVKQLVSVFQRRTKSDHFDLSLDSAILADRFYKMLSSI